MATLTSITIENFKGIGDAVTIPIRPITLLFGKNSSGKSTVLQALQYMVEVYQSSAGADPDRTKIGYADLGGFRSLVHRHDEKRKIRIRLDFGLSIEESESLKDHLKDYLKHKEVEVKSVSIEVVTGWEQNKEKAYPESFIIYGLNGVAWSRFMPTKRPGMMVGAFDEETDLIQRVSEQTESYRMPQWVSHRETTHIYWNIKHPFFKKWIGEHSYLNHYSLLFSTLLPELQSLSDDQKTMLDSDERELNSIHIDIKNLVEEKIKSINYLGPFREIPSRHFRPQKTPDESLWTKGIEAWNILGRDPTLIEKTNSYMEDFLKLGYTIKLEESVSLDMVLKLHNKENDIDLDLLGVGLGISQVIPVLVGVSHTGRSVAPDAIGIFAVEQPELHLHPAAQVALGDVFIDGIQNSSPTFLIETHSEHLLLRLLRRVHETSSTRVDTKYKLPPNDLSVVYVQSTPTGAKFTPVSVTDDGDFDEPWPEGFFEERDSELFYHA